jgi:hypothetical protein
MDWLEPEFRASTFIAGLCLDEDGEMQLAAGSTILELQFADDESPEALRRVRIEDVAEFGA